MKFNNVEITPETFEATKQYFIDLNKELIRQVKSDELIVNNPDNYVQWKQDNIEYYKNLENTINFTFLQRAYFIQTGDCLPLFN